MRLLNTIPRITFRLLLFALAFTLTVLVRADRTVNLTSSSCTNDPTGATISCTWSDGQGCVLRASDSTAGASCSGTSCHVYADPTTGCTTTTCCVSHTTVNDACNAFTGPTFTAVTSYIKPPPGNCYPHGICSY